VLDNVDPALTTKKPKSKYPVSFRYPTIQDSQGQQTHGKEIPNATV
jgi:hypothetical protein